MFENVRLALSSLRSNKMRALLTMLGIIIGIGSVIAIVTVGESLTGSITDSMSGLGGQQPDGGPHPEKHRQRFRSGQRGRANVWPKRPRGRGPDHQ